MDETFKMEKNVKIKILIWYMVGGVVKKCVGQGYIFHAIILVHYISICNCISKAKDVKNPNTLAYLNLNYGTTKQ